MLAFVAALAMPPGPPKGEVAAILAAYRQMFAYAAKHDPAGMVSVTTTDFTQKGIDGKTLTRAQLQKEYDAFFRTFRNSRFQWKVSTVRVTGSDATTVLLCTTTATSIDGKGKSHPVRIDERENVAWRKEGGVWKERSAVIVSERVYLDGKLMK